jgi:N-acetylglucosamine kinase-like BadF-type ATPase
MKKHVIGLDGGGTKTVGVLLNNNGEMLGRTVAGSSNIQAIGEEELADTFKTLVKELLKQAKIENTEIDHIYAGLAGAGRPKDKERVAQVFDALNLTKAYTVDTDAMAALAGSFSGGSGIIVISGTGAICFGKDEQGNVVRCSGWGYLLGDEGSGFYIGQQAIMAALKDLDGRGVKTALRAELEKKYNLDSIDLIISPIYSGQIDRSEIASNAPLVFDLAEQGDAAAEQIIQQAGIELGKIVAATAKRMKKENKNIQVALIGSIFNRINVLLPFIKKETDPISRHIDFIEPRWEPAVGSALLGLQQEGISINDELLETLIRTKLSA